MQVPLERVLQICMATLASLATLLLGMGERNAVLPLAGRGRRSQLRVLLRHARVGSI